MTSAKFDSTSRVTRDPSAERITTIQAHTMLSFSISMSAAELECLFTLLDTIDHMSLTQFQRSVRSEFLQAIDSVR
jgi:hypothetical protein